MEQLIAVRGSHADHEPNEPNKQNRFPVSPALVLSYRYTIMLWYYAIVLSSSLSPSLMNKQRRCEMDQVLTFNRRPSIHVLPTGTILIQTN